jgi:Ca2+:H+ antiporter
LHIDASAFPEAFLSAFCHRADNDNRFIWYNAKSHDSIFDDVLAADEEKDADRQRDLTKPRFTFTECIIALAFSLTLVSLIAVILVNEIHPMVEEYGIPDNFMGLILVPLVEKAAEHLTAIDEAWDDQMVSLPHL